MTIKSSIKSLTDGELALLALISTILFVVLGSQFMYGITSMLPVPCLSASGPSTMSLILHALVFWLVMFIILKIIKASN